MLHLKRINLGMLGQKVRWLNNVFLMLFNASDKHILKVNKENAKTTFMDVILNSAKIYLFKVNKKTLEKRCEICLKLTIKIPERRCFYR